MSEVQVSTWAEESRKQIMEQVIARFDKENPEKAGAVYGIAFDPSDTSVAVLECMDESIVQVMWVFLQDADRVSDEEWYEGVSGSTAELLNIDQLEGWTKELDLILDVAPDTGGCYCEDIEDTFIQNHGVCQYCYFVGE